MRMHINQSDYVGSQIMSNKLCAYAIQFADFPWIKQKLLFASHTLQGLANHKLPADDLPRLNFTTSQIIQYPQLLPVDDLLGDFRQTLITTFGIWHLPNQLWLNDLHHFISGRRVLEVMAGNGLISAGLRQLGDNVVATDSFDWENQDIQVPAPWTPVLKLTGLQAIKTIPFDVLIMSWAPDTDTSDVGILTALRHQNFTGDFIIIGEKNHATNSAQFWQMADLSTPLSLNKHHQPFDFIHDQVFLVK